MRSGMKLRIVPTTLEIGAHLPMADVDHRRAVAFERGCLDNRLVGVDIHLAQGSHRIEPLRVLLVAVKDQGPACKAFVDQRLGVLYAGCSER